MFKPYMAFFSLIFIPLFYLTNILENLFHFLKHIAFYSQKIFDPVWYFSDNLLFTSLSKEMASTSFKNLKWSFRLIYGFNSMTANKYLSSWSRWKCLQNLNSFLEKTRMISAFLSLQRTVQLIKNILESIAWLKWI